MTNKKIILLTGAGFTKNFGGLLAQEMWPMIFNHPEVQRSSILRPYMLSNFNYEDIYQALIDDHKLDDSEKVSMQKALLSAYESQEGYWNDKDFYLNFMNRDKLIKNLCQFISQYVGLFFTLNHDLFFETKLIKELRERTPNILANPTNDITDRASLPQEKELPLKIHTAEKQMLDEKNLPYIKIHGSINWLDSSAGKTIVIVGGKKKEKIEKEPLLAYYYKKFKEALQAHNQRLLIIGYGFMDNHINNEIYNGLKNGLKIHIIDTLNPEAFSNKMAQPKYNKNPSKEEIDNSVIRELIWLNMSGYFPLQSLSDLFTTDGVSPLYHKLIENMDLK